MPRDQLVPHLSSHKIGLFQCIYCRFGCNTIELIRLHLTDIHPTELAICAARYLAKSSNDETDKLHLIQMVKEVDENLLVFPPITMQQLNFMRTELNQFEFNTKSVPRDEAPTIRKRIDNDEDLQKGLKIFNAKTAVLYNVKMFDESQMVKKTSPKSRLLIKEKLTTNLSTKSSTASNSDPSTSDSGGIQLKIASVASGVDMKDPTKTIQNEIDAAARSLVNGTGLKPNELYRCGFSHCSQTIENGSLFLQHIKDDHGNGTAFECVHCNEVFADPKTFYSHIQTHGMHRFFCFRCNSTAPLKSVIDKHFIDIHQNSKTIMFPLNENQSDIQKDFFVVCEQGIKSLQNFCVKLVERNQERIKTTKKFYLPEEAEILPIQQIYTQMVYCKLCNYGSKVRSNIYRHLLKCDCKAKDETIPGTDPVNPVPCLNTGEKHFDKMRNLAASSNDAIALKNQINQKMQFVPDERRYVCGSSGCIYQTPFPETFGMHIDGLHKNERNYRCTHCNVDLSEGQPINVANVLEHLRFHGGQLFKCPMCDHLHYQKTKVEKHIAEMHPRCKDSAIFIQRSNRVEPTKSANKSIVFKWKCAICKLSFDTRSLCRAHMQNEHRLTSQYQCTKCSFHHDIKQSIKEHIHQKHGSNDPNLIRTLFERVDSVMDVTPIWRRDDPTRVSVSSNDPNDCSSDIDVDFL